MAFKVKAKSVVIGLAALGVIGAFAPDTSEPTEQTPDTTQTVMEQPSVKKENAPSVIIGDANADGTTPNSEPSQPDQPSTSQNSESAPEISPEQAFRESLKQYKYVGSVGSDKYHRPTCRWADKINDENLVHFDSKEEASAAGYEPCGTCNP